MKKSKRMQILVDIAKRKEDEVVKVLAKEQARLQQDQQKLQELKDYAEQYDQQRNLIGLSPYLTSNYQHFVDRLQQAITQQQNQVNRSQQQVNMAMRRWQEAQAKTKGMDWLKDKSVSEEIAAEDRQDQKQIDEFANRAFFNRMRS
ncbi:flagellar export protein FliJ [Marinomonas ostreistagni]|uniref:flagellar export protein FliJ n=1 Tax=Marinomonas ostreistagni TaxID=359209 RepID=UPI0019508F78|nr:flagellar export protein FliJ [Marinomonas ostreistagni]MBM6551246.1 flagellar export protein FliJ [Marinomonas ostreistagni]